jgi:23S rRNA (adenine-N6)-dimethyltransferase
VPGSRRAWGWHPLTDEWAARVVADAGVRRGDLVVELGAGRGALTAHLVAAGARVLAVELHPGRASHLRERFAADPVTVVPADALTVRLPHRPFRVVANPPYAIGSPLLRMLLSARSGLTGADLVLPRTVVRRFAGGGVRLPPRWRLSHGRALPRRAFSPPPQIDSAVLVVRRG